LNLAVPVSLSHALLRKISKAWMDSRPRGPAEWRERLQRRLLQCPFPVELGVNGLSAAVSELAGMAPGTLLPLRRSAAEAASLIVAGVEMFGAAPARAGNTRAASVLERTLQTEVMPGGKETRKR